MAELTPQEIEALREGAGNVPKKHPNYFVNIWNKYGKYIVIVALILYLTFDWLMPWIRSKFPSKFLIDETAYLKLIFSIVANLAAFSFAIFMCWIGFGTADDFLTGEWRDAFNSLGKGDLNKGVLWKILLSLIILLFFYWAFLYGIGTAE